MEKYFKVGMKVWDVSFGEGKVVQIHDDNLYPIRVEFAKKIARYTYDGKYLTNVTNTSLYQTEPILTPNVPINEFEQDELVLVRDLGEWLLRYFSHFEDGKYWCYSNQRTEGNVNAWNQISKLTDNPLLTKTE